MTSIDDTWYIRPSDVRDRTSAGGFVVRRDNNGTVLVAFAREGDHENLVIPKGGVDDGETTEDAAKREIEEELGILAANLTTLTELGTRARLTYNRRYWVTTHYFVFITDQIDGTPTDTKRHWHGPTWVPLDDSPELFWPEQTKLFADNIELIRSLV
ncbi:MAG: NUDIX hydrolase [Planctomycetota bacterium]